MDRIPDNVLHDRTECECLNLLQDFGIISDLVVDWQDVGNPGEAIAWLAMNPTTR